MKTSLQGKLLIANRELSDPNFFQSVVLMLQHDTDGAVGLVVNRPSEARLKALWKKLEGGSCRYEGPLYRGGPCEGPLMALHDNVALADSTIIEGLYHSTSREAIAELVAKPPKILKIFAGYSGWGDEQLDNEMKEGSWLVAPAKLEYFASDDDHLWRTVTSGIIGAALIKAAQVKHVPNDLRMN